MIFDIIYSKEDADKTDGNNDPAFMNSSVLLILLH